MNTLNLTVFGGYAKNLAIYIDGKRVKTKKSLGSAYSAKYCTDKSSVELSVCSLFDMNTSLWFLKALFFFIISCFGIFDTPYDGKGYALNYRANLQLGPVSDMQLRCEPFYEGQRAVKFFGNCGINEQINEYYIDVKAKKRVKAFRIFKALFWVALIIGAIAVAVISIIG